MRRRLRYRRRRQIRRRRREMCCSDAARIGDHQQLVECIWDHIHPTDSVTAFEVTKRVAWALRGEGAGDLIKNGGENIVAWRGYSFSASRIVYPDGRLVKVIFDAGPGGANGPSWQDDGDYVDRKSLRAGDRSDASVIRGLRASGSRLPRSPEPRARSLAARGPA